MRLILSRVVNKETHTKQQLTIISGSRYYKALRETWARIAWKNKRKIGEPQFCFILENRMNNNFCKTNYHRKQMTSSCLCFLSKDKISFSVPYEPVLFKKILRRPAHEGSKWKITLYDTAVARKLQTGE